MPCHKRHESDSSGEARQTTLERQLPRSTRRRPPLARLWRSCREGRTLNTAPGPRAPHEVTGFSGISGVEASEPAHRAMRRAAPPRESTHARNTQWRAHGAVEVPQLGSLVKLLVKHRVVALWIARELFRELRDALASGNFGVTVPDPNSASRGWCPGLVATRWTRGCAASASRRDCPLDSRAIRWGEKAGLTRRSRREEGAPPDTGGSAHLPSRGVHRKHRAPCDRASRPTPRPRGHGRPCGTAP